MEFNLQLINDSTFRSLKVSGRDSSYLFNLGIEIGTLETFFSFENRLLGKSSQKNLTFKSDAESWEFGGEIIFQKAHIQVSERGIVSKGNGERTILINAINHSLLMDCVLRFVIPKEQIKVAKIGSQIIKHERRNKYHQFASNEVELILYSGYVIKFTPFEVNLPEGFSSVVYLRDEPKDWILHFRALSLSPSEYSLKGCIRWFNRPFPIVIQRFIFKVFPGVRQRLLYVRERISQRIPIQVNGASVLRAGEAIKMSVRWEVKDAS